MAQYTATEIKALTVVPRVSQWGNVKILSFQTTAESILISLDLDSSKTGYSDVYASAVIRLFDFIANNPTGLQKSVQGKITKEAILGALPPYLQLTLDTFIQSSNGTLTPVKFERSDVGLR